ncbi:Major facilitator superfamily domain [Phytophthora cactorum]|nr:Major facilitator superfamily domain [Phytophthora cactorum]
MIMYASILVALLQPFQSGWSSSQTNLSQYNDTDECNARPVADDTCLVFPGHSKLEWTFAVNAWIFGGMIGSLICGHFSDLWGRKKLLFVNCIFMIVGAVVEAAVSNVWAFSAGRLISGIASGTATGTLGAYTNELTPPHMRNILGLGLQISVTIGILFPAICFFFANTSSGWRYLAGFPVILAVLFLVLAPSLCVESPAWLLMKNRRDEAKQPDAEQGLSQASAEQDSLFSPKYRLQLAAAILLSCAQQLSGINAVFYYSGSIFKDAGISDPRRFGNRNMILWGEAGMFIMAVLMTVVFLVDVPALSIVFTALYVIAFGLTLGPLVWVITADLFPDSLCNLIVGVAYPYIADGLDDYSYLPFVVLLAFFFLLSLKLVPETSNKSADEVLREYEDRYRNRQ